MRWLCHSPIWSAKQSRSCESTIKELCKPKQTLSNEPQLISMPRSQA